MFFINGVIHLLEGIGWSIESLFGKSFVHINNEQISIKPSLKDKEKSINWNEIKSIVYKNNQFRILKTDQSAFILDLSKLGFV